MLSYQFYGYKYITRQVVGLFICLVSLSEVKAQSNTIKENSVYQYSVKVGSKEAYLWIPEKCKQVRGIIISFDNLLERNWLEDPIIRNEAAKDNLAIILVEESNNGITPDMTIPNQQAFLKMLNDMAKVSGYHEIQYAPFIPIDHSVYGTLTWNLPSWLPEKTIAAIPVKTYALPTNLYFKNIPICYIIGENDEWPPIKDGRLWSRDFVWREIQESAVNLRNANYNNIVGVVTDAGGGHLDWSNHLSEFMALFIHKACEYRLPKYTASNKYPKLKNIQLQKGWLTDSGGLEPDQFEPAPYKKYKGYPKNAYWYFDEETAKAAVKFSGDRKTRKPQMLTFAQNGKQVPVSKFGFVPLQYLPEQDGITFKVEGDFLATIPADLTGVGNKLEHAGGDIKFRVITGPAIQTGANTFQIEFNRSSPGGDVWLQEEHPGNDEYKHVVQPAQMKVPTKLINGKAQVINFPEIENQWAGVKEIHLSATSDSGLPVRYYIRYGPAIVEGNLLKITQIPAKNSYPIKIEIVAYQWGRIIEPLYQSAELVSRTFLIKR